MSIYSLSATLGIHRQCVGDAPRTDAYARAIREVVKHHDVVVDLGAGTGILAMMACRAGARRVYAVEPDPIIESARQICAVNGFAEQVSCLQGLSYDVAIPEPADVLIAGHLHNFGLETGLLSSILDARQRFLKPGATIIPQSLELMVVFVELPEEYDKVISFWKSAPLGIDYSPVHTLAANTCHQVAIDGASFLTEAMTLASLQMDQLTNTFVSGRVAAVATRAGVLHGIAGWISAQLSASVTLSNSPMAPTAHWDQIYFPLAEPVSVNEGDGLTCSIATSDGRIWRWQVEIQPSGARFEHSNFHPELYLQDTVKRRSSGFVPRLSRKGEAELFVLNLCDGARTPAEIETELAANYADCFSATTTAAEFMNAVLDRSAL